MSTGYRAGDKPNNIDLLRLRVRSAPTARRVRRPHRLDVRDRADHRPDLGLNVSLDGRLRGAAVRLAPYEGHLGPRLCMFRVEDREGEHPALVCAVADPGGDPDRLAVHGDLVERVHGVDGGR